MPYFVGSMDALWETHCHRRLSEAGLSRHTDHTVLTEDTDSFIIGQKVWVGGTKPGKIAYIGETQFAPGEWAGIVLDQPIGKNDGSVAGTRYFQCEPKHGVFSRLTRLTSIPLPGADLGDTTYTFTPPSPTNTNAGRSSMSPSGSTKSLRKSPPLNISSTSLSSPTHVDFKIGDRVIIKSSQGSKVGTVRFIGTTEFATGDWCGVELDEPRGKNDGSVEGNRYFTCRPLYGLFAPLAKVSKSPLKYKPGNCVIHSSAGLKKAGSRESMTSINSSMISGVSGASNIRRVRLGINSLNSQVRQKTPSSASLSTRTALQDVLREKQQHIEQLLKERDLERAEISRAASQADDAEQKLATLQAEYEKYRSECESKLKEFSSLVSSLNIDKDDLLSQLDEEKRKNEDILFRFEEAAITKGDVEVENERNRTKIKELEEQLKIERQKVDNLETDSQKLFETEEALVSTREELDALKKEQEELKVEKVETKIKLLKNDELIKKLEDSLKEVQQNSLKVTKDSEDEHIKKISKIEEEFKEKLKQKDDDLERVKREIGEQSGNCQKQNEEINMLKEELAGTKKLLEEKSNELEKVTAERNEQQKIIEKYKMEISSKVLDMDNLNENLNQKESSLKTLQRDYEVSVVNLKAKDEEIERQKSHALQTEENLKKEIETLRTSVQNVTTQKEASEKELLIITSQKDTIAKELGESVEKSKTEVEKLKKEVEDLKKQSESSQDEIISRHKRQIEDKEAAIIALTNELERSKKDVTENQATASTLEENLSKKNEAVTKLEKELELVRKECQMQVNSYNSLNNEIASLQLENSDLKRSADLNQETLERLKEDKYRLETEIQTIMSSSGEYSVKLEQMMNEMLEKDRRLQSLDTEYKVRIQECEKAEDGLKMQLQQAQEESVTLRNRLESELLKALEGEKNMRKEWESAVSDNNTISMRFNGQLSEVNAALSQKEFALIQLRQEAQERERQLQSQVDMVNEELRKIMESNTMKVGETEMEVLKLKSELNTKSEEILETEMKVKICQLEAEQRLENMRNDYESLLKNKEFELEQKQAALATLQAEIQLLQRDCTTNNVDVAAKNSQIATLIEEAAVLRQLVQKTAAEKGELLISITEANNKFVTNSQLCADLMDQVADLSKKAKLADEFSEKLHLQQLNFVKFVQLLGIGEERKQKAINRLQEAAESNGESEQCKNILTIAKNIQVASIDDDTKAINNLQVLLENANHQLKEKEKELQLQQREIVTLQKEVLQVQHSSHPGIVPSEGDNINGNNIGYTNVDRNQLIEEKKIADSQIDFLNSIIVDMQKKNAEQKAKIEILESGYSPAAAEELKLTGLSEHKRAPRAYCDICEQFDLHETEDCPLQAAEEEQHPSQKSPRSAPPYSRSYCEICEMFGHCTEDCKDDQTF